MQEKRTFLVKINWFGEVHKFYTTTQDAKSAFRNALNRLAKKVGYPLISVQQHLSEGDKVKIFEA